MATVRLAGKDVELVVPGSYCVRSEISLATHTVWRRALAAAIGVCWSAASDRNPNRQYAYRGDVTTYGAAILDYLHGLGVPEVEFRAAGAIALSLIQEGLDWGAEVEKASGNSDAGESPAPTDGHPTVSSPKSKRSGAGSRARSRG